MRDTPSTLPDYRIVVDYRGDYMVGVVEDGELANAFYYTFPTRWQAEAALAELERAEAEEGEAS